MEEEKTTVNNIYGFQFNGCHIENSTFQTLVQGNQQTGVNEGGSSATDAPSPARKAGEQDDATPMPPTLSTPRAQTLFSKLTAGGLLDECRQPQKLSNAEKGVLASLIATRLEIDTPWQTFGHLWNMKPETLRAAFNKGLEQRKTAAFMDRVKQLMAE